MDANLAPRRLNLAEYSGSQSTALRIISISSSSASLLATLITFYTYLAIHPSRKKFRHQLIIFLIIFDFLKALAMIIFPVLTYVDPLNTGQKTINFLGWFTAFSIEGSDLAILSFAIHTLLTIFAPQRTGGLYFIRYYVYVMSFVIPALLASLAFINNTGYSALDVFCYLPERPIWYRLVLSWGPRYFIMVAIILIYCTIYFYVINQLHKMETQQSGGLSLDSESTTSEHWYSKFSLRRLILSPYYKQQEQQQKQQEEQGSQFSPTMLSNKNSTFISNININNQLQLDNNQRLKTRYKVIARQIKIIFLYPIAYFLLWIFPLIQNSFRLELKSNFGLTVICAFIQPFNGVIDTIVYLYRERPWELTYMKTPRSPFAPDEEISRWRFWVSWLPLFHLPDDINHTQQNNHPSSSSDDQIFDDDEDDDKLDYITNANAINMSNLNPEEFLNSDGLSNSIVDSTGTPMKKLNSTDDDINSQDDEIDLMDFLNRGPPV